MKNFFKYVLATIIGIFGFFMIVGAVFFIFALISSLFSSNEQSLPSKGILKINLDTPIYDTASEKESSFFSNPEADNNVYYRDILRIIKQAKDDDHIKGISIQTSFANGGITQDNDIRKALLDFKESGKFIYSYGVNLSQSGYLIASVADSIFLNPLGQVELKGLVAQELFFKNFGEKYGIDFQVIRHGKYKSAVEPFIRTDFSEENRLQYSEILNGIWGNISKEMSKSRNLSEAQFNLDIDSLYGFVSNTALEYKLIDGLMQENEYLDFLKSKIGIDEDKDLELVSLRHYKPHLKKEKSSNQVAVIYATGGIMDGDGSEGIFSEPYKKMIRDLTDNNSIKAVVLRVNSGGGSAIASDEILYELKRLKEKKHLVVSFGDIAASGGYYIGMAGEKIFADPNTITGSIGVLGMLPSFEKLTNRWGITSDYVQTNSNSLFYSPFVNLSSGSKHALVQSVEHTYNRFLQVVSENREMSVSQIDSLAQGRVWTGQAAYKQGLVDELGSLEDALKYVSELAELDDYRVVSYPKAKDKFELWVKMLNDVYSSDRIVKSQLGEKQYKLYQKIKQLQEMEGVLMYQPMQVIF